MYVHYKLILFLYRWAKTFWILDFFYVLKYPILPILIFLLFFVCIHHMKPARGPQTIFFSNYCSGIPGLANYEMPSEVC